MSDGRVAFVGGDRQIWTMDASATGHKQVTFGEGGGAPTPWGMLQSKDHSNWPCWSPDGRWLSCFQTRVGPDGEGNIWVAAVEVDGVEEQRLTNLDGSMPIYAQWSPDSRQLAVLAQEDTHLSLGVCQLGSVGAYRVMEEGVPLFFSWTTDANRLLIHSGYDGDTRLVLRDVRGDAPDEMFGKSPGNFCTPLVVGDQAVFVGRDDKHGVLCVSDWAGNDIQGVTGIEGLVAVVASPDGHRLAFSGAPPKNRAPYQGLWLADLENGGVSKILDGGLVAFYWLPDSTGLLLVTHGRGPAELHWSLLSLGETEPQALAAFYPSMDQKFFLHYFEQFAVSHSPVSADGERLVFASHPNPRGAIADSTSHICMVDLTASTPRTEVCVPGDFAVFSP